VVVNGYTVEEPTIAIVSRACAYNPVDAIDNAITASNFLISDSFV
jgi:hypothetical protein